MAIIRNRSFAPILFTVTFLLSFMWYWHIFQDSLRPMLQNCSEPVREEKEEKIAQVAPSELQMKINKIFNKIHKLISKAPFTQFNRTTSGRNSKSSIANPRAKYCVGEDFVVQLDMYDYIGNRKTYGGDFIRPRIFSPDLSAALSGRVEDFNNGTYHIHFHLYWEGRVKSSILLFHPSEGVSALWRARHASLGVIGFQGKFISLGQEAITTCGFRLDTTDKEVCEYIDADNEEAFYCIKPPNLPCDCLHDMRGVDLQVSYLSNEEKQLFQRSNIGIDIPKNFDFIDVIKCNKAESSAKPKCKTGMSSPVPSGYFLNNVWNPVFCNMTLYQTGEDFTKCLQGKKLFLIGDSTLRQYIMHFTEGIKIIKYFAYHWSGFAFWEKTLLALNMEKDIYVSYKRHGFPLESFIFYYFKEDKYTSDQIDLQGGGKDTIVAITMGQHFRQFPLHLYIRRAINIRKAIQRLFLRSPDTKVIIKTENTRDTNTAVERIGDFHGYTQYLVLREVFQGIDVGFVDAWDMSIASATENVHPPGKALESIMSMTFTYAC